MPRLNAQLRTSRTAREPSPGKNVHFPRRLIMGPNDPNRRSMSPVRPALHRAETRVDDPSTQPLSERKQASPVRVAKRKTSESAIGSGTPCKKQISSKTRKTSPTKTLSATRKGGNAPQPEAEAEVFSKHVEVCDELNRLKSKIRAFAESFGKPNDPANVLSSLLVKRNEQLIRYIGCLAMGGSNSVQEWEDVLNDISCRHALVFGIVGRALKENVFDQLCFGADAKLKTKLEKLEHDGFQQDGFFRTRQRASAILEGTGKSIATISFQKSVAEVAMQLEYLLLPFWSQGSTMDEWEERPQEQLATIVESAATLAQKMRSDSQTVYYWPPTFKDEEFDPARMECYNLGHMMKNSPYISKKVKGTDRAILRGRADEREAIVTVICFPGLVAYRQGGGDFVDHEAGKGKIEGFRTAILGKGVVMLQWGQQRLLTKEAGTSRHIEAMKTGDKEGRYKDRSQFKGLFDLYLHHKAGTASLGDSPLSQWRMPSLFK